MMEPFLINYFGSVKAFCVFYPVLRADLLVYFTRFIADVACSLCEPLSHVRYSRWKLAHGFLRNVPNVPQVYPSLSESASVCWVLS